MKYSVKLEVNATFECNDEKELKVKTWEAVYKPYGECIFGNKKGEELKFITLKDSTGKVIDLSEETDLYKICDYCHKRVYLADFTLVSNMCDNCVKKNGVDL